MCSCDVLKLLKIAQAVGTSVYTITFTHILPIEFEIRTVSYRPSFSVDLWQRKGTLFKCLVVLAL